MAEKQPKERLDEVLDQLTLAYREGLLGQVWRAESPIEEILGVVLFDEFTTYLPQWSGIRDIRLQHPVEIGNRTYRLDIAVWGLNGRMIDVECDGHDFHEKTKQQAQRDKRRDRDIQQLGWNVMRFTGAEIWKNPWACAGEIGRLLRTPLSAGHDPNS